MLNFNNLTRQELSNNGFAFETAEEASLFASIIKEELEVRIGEAIVEHAGHDKAAEFEKCETDAEAAAWLKQNCPDYREIVEVKQRELNREIMKYRDRIPGLVVDAPSPFRDMAIEDMDLSVRSYNCLKRAGIHTVGDLYDYGDFSTIRNLGRKCADEIREKLWELSDPQPELEFSEFDDIDAEFTDDDDIEDPRYDALDDEMSRRTNNNGIRD